MSACSLSPKDDIVLHHKCHQHHTSSGFDLALHVPVLPTSLTNGDLVFFLGALEGAARSSDGAFRFDEWRVTIDSKVKTASGALSACCDAEDAVLSDHFAQNAKRML